MVQTLSEPQEEEPLRLDGHGALTQTAVPMPDGRAAD